MDAKSVWGEITEDNQYGFQRNGSNFGDFFHQTVDNEWENNQIFMYFKKSCDSARSGVSYNKFIDFYLTIKIFMVIKCI